MRDHPVREGERRDPAVYWLHQLIEKVPPVKQSIHIKIPLPLHGQLKSLAAKRNVTMPVRAVGSGRAVWAKRYST